MQTENENRYDCAIIGGGLAGLCLAIQLAGKQHSVIVFEKNEYPFHKVCGEYISNESRYFLESLGLPVSKMHLPEINQLGISSTKGFMLEAPLNLGGFGISRYTLDNELAKLAREAGVKIIENCKVSDVQLIDNDYTITTTSGNFKARITCGSYGKHSPVFMDKNSKIKAPNYIGVKYHIKTNLAANRIELHNFKDGYCGISKVDDEAYCLCYLTTAKNLKENNNDISQLEKNVLRKNPFLETYFSGSEFLFEKPLVISSVTFNKKTTGSNGIFLLGDASGAIAPLCGNGMSMGMRASKLLAELLTAYFNDQLTKEDLAKKYRKAWNANFSTRIKAGYYLQQILGKNSVTHASLKVLNTMPALLQKLISLTHGKTF